MRIIKTRYRDVPWEEVKNCFIDRDDEGCHEYWENNIRAKDLQVISPPVDPIRNYGGCQGPHYEITGKTDYGFDKITVCPHIAEIGD